MKTTMRNLSLIIAISVVMAVTSSAGKSFASKTYRIKGVEIAAQAQADGSLQISEERTYRFKGSFRYAYRTFALKGGIDYSDFQVSEEGLPFIQNDSEDPGTFKVIPKDEKIEIRWFYKARNQTRTFQLDYTVKNLVQRYSDAAVLYYQFLGSDFKKSSANVKLTVKSPVNLTSFQIQQWLHGPLWAESETRNDGTIVAWCEKLPAHQFFELRALYPLEAFPEAPVRDGFIVGEVRSEEAALAEEANRQRIKAQEKAVQREKRLKQGSIVVPVIGLMGLVVWVGVFRRFRKTTNLKSLPGEAPRSPSDLPSDLPPALVGYLIADRAVNGNTLTGTLLDLAQRGFLEFHEDSQVRKYALGIKSKKDKHFWTLQKEYYQEHGHELLPYEEMLVKFVFDELAGGERADVDLFKKNQSQTRAFFQKWSKAVTKEGEKRNFYSPAGFRGRNLGIMVGGALCLLTLPLGFIYYQWAFLTGLLGVLLCLLSLAIVHHSEQGARQASDWKALHKSLKKDRSRLAGFPNNIGRYLVYGVALNIGSKALTELGNGIPDGRHNIFLPWFYSQNKDGDFAGGSFGSSFSSSVAAAGSSMSSAAGAGGGASGGGGGGAGGGGGGAG